MDKCGKSSGHRVAVGLVGKLVYLFGDIMSNLAQRYIKNIDIGGI